MSVYKIFKTGCAGSLGSNTTDFEQTFSRPFCDRLLISSSEKLEDTEWHRNPGSISLRAPEAAKKTSLCDH
jgi:hypothetical protein